MDKSIDWIRMIYIDVLNADLDRQKPLLVMLGAKPESIAEMRYDDQEEKPKRVATLDQLQAMGIGSNNRFKKVKHG
jgi:hypothetical protein